MLAIIVKEIGSFEICEVEKPKPKKGEALVEVAVAGLCRTDLKIIEVGHRDLVLPRIPAEEVVGIIRKVGSEADRNLIGKRVYIYPGTNCGECLECKNGACNLCEEMQIMGFHRHGGFAEFVISPVQSLIEIPDETPFDHAVFAEPLSCCLNALELARLQPNETIAIWGAGPAGTLLARAATAAGAKPTVIEPDEHRRRLINGLKKAPDNLFDIAISAVGSGKTYQEALGLLRPRGRLVVFSGLSKIETLQSVDFNQIHYLEQTIVGAYGCSYRHGRDALDWISSGKIMVEDMISHRLPLTDLSSALDLVRNRLGMKILLYPNKKGK